MIAQKQLRKWRLPIFFLCVGILGLFLGYRLHEEGVRQGCFTLSEDVKPVQIVPGVPGRLKVIVVGDTGTGTSDQHAVASSMARVCAEAGCDLMLMLGDNFYPSGLAGVADPQFIKDFEEVYGGMEIPVAAVLGNHDIKGDASAQVMLSLGSAHWLMPNYSYRFEAGPVRFYGINTNCHLHALMWLKQNLDVDFMQSRITDASAKRPWALVFGHHPVYSNGVHGDGDLLLRMYWKGWLDNRVDFYLAGHDHHLAHFQNPESPTDFLISGAGGNHYRNAEEQSRLTQSNALSLFTHHDNGFVWMEFTRQHVIARFFGREGETLYEFVRDRAQVL